MYPLAMDGKLGYEDYSTSHICIVEAKRLCKWIFENGGCFLTRLLRFIQPTTDSIASLSSVNSSQRTIREFLESSHVCGIPFTRFIKPEKERNVYQ